MRKLRNRVVLDNFLRRPRVESLESRLLLSAEPLSPQSALVYQERLSGQIFTAGGLTSRTIELDGGQTLSLALETTGGLIAILKLRGPDGTGIASQLGSRFQLEKLPIDQAGEYTFDVTGDGFSVGDFTIDVFLNAVLEDEQFGGPGNDKAASAEGLMGSELKLGGGASRFAIVGGGSSADTEDWYSFTLDVDVAASLVLSDDEIGSDIKLELYDAKQTLLGVGITDARVDQAIPNFVDRTSDALKETYFARVVAPESPYRLSLTVDTTVELGDGNAFSSAQAIGITGSVLGFVDQVLGASINPLSSYRGTEGTNSPGPPDPILAVGPDHVITMVNTRIAAYDKVTSNKLYEQDLSFANGFFGSVGATDVVFDPWVIYDTDSARYYALGIDRTTANTSHIFLAVSKDSTPTSINDWHKYKIDFTHIPDGTGLGTGPHFPDYPKLSVSQDAVFISGNYFAISSGTGSYAGVTAIAREPLLTGDAVNILYEEHFSGFSVFPLQHQGDSRTQYFAEAVGTDTIRMHGVTDVLADPVRHTFDMQVDPFSEPINVPQPGGAVPADALNDRVMTGVWRDGSGWFGHPITDPAIGDNETVARWYEVSTNNFPKADPTLVQSGNVDPGPGLHAWMPALAVNAAGSMAIGFSLGGPDRFFGAGYTGRLATDPPGTVTTPVYEWIDGQAIYETIDGKQRNRWGDYSGMVVDPSDDTTFWVNNEFASSVDLWSTEIGSFQIDVIPESDWYRFEVGANETFTVNSSTPFDGSHAPVNELDPSLELYDPSGVLIALDDNSAADGRNASITHTASVAGAYRVRVYGADSTLGNYLLDVSPLAFLAPPISILDTIPEPGQRLNLFPDTVTVELSEPVLASSVAATDLSVNGVAATSVTIVDGLTLVFTIDASVYDVDGIYSIEIPAGSFDNLSRGVLQLAWDEMFVVDVESPIITSALWNGDTFPSNGLLPAGPLVVEGDLSEGVLFSPGQDRVSVVDRDTGVTVQANRVEYDADTMRFTANFDDPLPEGNYTLTIVSGEGAFADDAGNALDGEPLGGNLDGTPTGDGSPGGDYTVDFTLDATVMDARDFAQVRPGGSLVYVSQGNAGLLVDDRDEDRIRFFALAGQTIAAKVTFTEPVMATAEFVGLTAPIQNVPGSPLDIPPTVVGVDGFIELRLTGDATSRYTVDALINSGFEVQFGDGTVGQPIDDTRLEIGTGQWAVWGEANDALSDVDLYTIDLAAARGAFLDIAIKGQDNDLTGGTLELLDPAGAVVATASSGETFDLQILEVAIPDLSAGSRFGLRVTTTTAGNYLLLVRDGQKIETEADGNGGPRALTDGGRAIGYLVSDQSVVVEPDDYASGTDLSNAVPGVTFSRFTGGAIYASEVDPDFFVAPTGTRVFGSDAFGPLGFRFGGDMLYLTFDEPVAMVSIERGTKVTGTASLLTFDEHDDLLELTTTSLALDNLHADMVISRSQADIHFALAAGLFVIPFDRVTFATMAPDPSDRFLLEATAGEVITIATDTPLDHPHGVPSNNLDPELVIFHPDGTTVLAQDTDSLDGKNAQVTFAVPATGTYVVEVRTTSGTGEYRIELDRAIPVAVDDAIRVEKGRVTTRLSSGAASVLANDLGLADTPIQVTLDAGPTHADLQLAADGTFSYTHDGSEELTDSFSYTITDYNGQSASATVSVTVTPVEPPAEEDLIRVDEGATTTVFQSGATSVLETLPGLGDGPFVLVVQTPPEFAEDFQLNQDGTFRYEHDGSENFSDSFVVRVANVEGQKKTGIATVMIAINPVSDTDPLAVSDLAAVEIGETVTVLTSGQKSVLANDQGLEDTPVVVSLEIEPVHDANFTLTPTGQFSYEHDGSANLSDSFVYRITDNDGQVSTATVTIRIVPAIETTADITLSEGGVATKLDTGEDSVLALATGLGDIPVVLSVETPPRFANLQLNDDGTFLYKHDGSENFSDSFVVRLTEDQQPKKAGTVTVTILINRVSDTDPLAISDFANVKAGGTVTMLDSGKQSVLANDQGLVDGPVLVSREVAPDHAASFTLSNDGTFSYEHDGSENLSDRFVYRITDNDGQVSTATVTIRISQVSTNTPGLIENQSMVFDALDTKPVDLTRAALATIDLVADQRVDTSAVASVEDQQTVSARWDNGISEDEFGHPQSFPAIRAGAAERHVAVDFQRFLILASKYNRSVNAVSRDGDFDDDTWDSFAIFLLLSSDFAKSGQADPMPIADGSQFGVAVDAILAEDQPGLDWLAR